MKTILKLAVVLIASSVSSGGLVTRAAAEGRSTERPATFRTEVSLQRGTCAGTATASCYAQHGRNRRAAQDCLAVRIDACEEAYASLPSEPRDHLALSR